MPSNEATLNRERERTQRYAHQSATGNPDNDTTRNERGSRDDTLHLSNSDASHKHEQEDDASQTSCSEQEREIATFMSNNRDLMHSQYDGTFDSSRRRCRRPQVTLRAPSAQFEDVPSVDAYTDRLEHGESSRAAEP